MFIFRATTVAATTVAATSPGAGTAVAIFYFAKSRQDCGLAGLTSRGGPGHHNVDCLMF